MAFGSWVFSPLDFPWFHILLTSPPGPWLVLVVSFGDVLGEAAIGELPWRGEAVPWCVKVGNSMGNEPGSEPSLHGANSLAIPVIFWGFVRKASKNAPHFIGKYTSILSSPLSPPVFYHRVFLLPNMVWISMKSITSRRFNSPFSAENISRDYQKEK